MARRRQIPPAKLAEAGVRATQSAGKRRRQSPAALLAAVGAPIDTGIVPPSSPPDPGSPPPDEPQGRARRFWGHSYYSELTSRGGLNTAMLNEGEFNSPGSLGDLFDEGARIPPPGTEDNVDPPPFALDTPGAGFDQGIWAERPPTAQSEGAANARAEGSARARTRGQIAGRAQVAAAGRAVLSISTQVVAIDDAARADIFRRLDAIEKGLLAFTPFIDAAERKAAEGGRIGDNNPPEPIDALPLTKAEFEMGTAAANTSAIEIATSKAPRVDIINLLVKTLKWIGEKIDKFLNHGLKAAAASFGLGMGAVGVLEICNILHIQIPQLVEILEHLPHP